MMPSILFDIAFITCLVYTVAKFINFRLEIVEKEFQKIKEAKRTAHIRAISGDHEEAIAWEEFPNSK